MNKERFEDGIKQVMLWLLFYVVASICLNTEKSNQLRRSWRLKPWILSNESGRWWWRRHSRNYIGMDDARGGIFIGALSSSSIKCRMAMRESICSVLGDSDWHIDRINRCETNARRTFSFHEFEYCILVIIIGGFKIYAKHSNYFWQ